MTLKINYKFQYSIHIFIWAILLVLAGSIMQGYANNTFDAILVAFPMMLLGIVIVNILFANLAEKNVFLLSYGVYLFIGGIIQCYSLATFNNPQSTIDAVNSFFPYIASQPPFTSMADIAILLESCLPIVLWQQVYKITWFFNLEHGIYTGIMFNALIMALTGSITVKIAREVYGNDFYRLKKVVILYTSCGLFIMFGTIFIRDCFTTFLNALVLLVIIRWLAKPCYINFIISLITTLLSAIIMSFLRLEAVVLFGIFWALAFLFWYIKNRFDKVRLIIFIFVMCVMDVLGSFTTEYVKSIISTQTNGMEQYNSFSDNENSGNSLGMRLIINQPLPIRLIMGTGSMMINPLPLWIYWKSGIGELYLIKGYQGFYQVFTFPLFFLGIFLSLKHFLKNRSTMIPILFLAAYFIINVLAVVSTSLEQRHLAQFFPAYIILATVPNTRCRIINSKLRSIYKLWLCFVAFLHLIWLILKG